MNQRVIAPNSEKREREKSLPEQFIGTRDLSSSRGSSIAEKRQRGKLKKSNGAIQHRPEIEREGSNNSTHRIIVVVCTFSEPGERETGLDENECKGKKFNSPI